MEDQCRALAGLAAPAQRMRSVSGSLDGQSKSPDDNGRHNGGGNGEDTSGAAKETSDATCQEKSGGDGTC